MSRVSQRIIFYLETRFNWPNVEKYFIFCILIINFLILVNHNCVKIAQILQMNASENQFKLKMDIGEKMNYQMILFYAKTRRIYVKEYLFWKNKFAHRDIPVHCAKVVTLKKMFGIQNMDIQDIYPAIRVVKISKLSSFIFSMHFLCLFM